MERRSFCEVSTWALIPLGISKDGYLRLWDILESKPYPIYEICRINKRWMYDVVWDPSIQRLHYLPYNVLYLNEELSNKSNLIKENATSVSSRHTSKLVLLSSINGCVYGIQKHTKHKEKPKDINAEVLFRYPFMRADICLESRNNPITARALTLSSRNKRTCRRSIKSRRSSLCEIL